MSALVKHQDFDLSTATTLDEPFLRRIVPSAFAATKHDSRSARFVPVPTIDALRKLETLDWIPVWARQTKTREVGRQAFTRHLIRLRHRDLKKFRVEAGPLEVVIRNANDGTSRYELFLGVFRFACSNGLIFFNEKHGMVSVRHVGNIAEAVVAGTDKVLENTAMVADAISNWRSVDMSPEARKEFGDKVRLLRFAKDTPITADMILTPRRPADTATDLWTVFNVAQENILAGGLSAMRAGRPHFGRQNFAERRVHTKPIASVDTNVQLNRDLWGLAAETYKELAKAA